MAMALLLKSDGSQEIITPRNEQFFSLEELQWFVGGYIELVTLNQHGHEALCNTLSERSDAHLIMYVNEDGFYRGLSLNSYAAMYTNHEMLFGTAIVGSADVMDAPNDIDAA